MPGTDSIGVLSQILSPSPSIRWILPARIRHQQYNDVVFVGQHSVHLREFLPNGQLAKSSARLDMESPILAAKVISAHTEEVEELKPLESESHVQERKIYSIKGREMDSSLPPSMVVLSLASCDLLFLYAKTLPSNRTVFVSARKKLLMDVSLPENYAVHLALDHESRAMATAPSRDSCGIYSLKPLDELHREMEAYDPAKPGSFRPTREDHFLEIDGKIMQMDFLPNPRDPNRILLVLLVATRSGTMLVVYEWNEHRSLTHARALRCSGQILSIEDSLPAMLIPSSCCTSFIIVTETGFVVYDNILSSRAKRCAFSLSRGNSGNYENSSLPPLWVQWAKPARHQQYMKNHDDIYLIREDGELRYWQINHDIPTKIEMHYSPGKLDISVDRAFAALGGLPKFPGDILLAGGDMTDGGVFHIQAREKATCTQLIPNYAPVRDMLTINAHDYPGSKALHSAARLERTFICSGTTSNYSFVSEMRYGLEAQVQFDIEAEDLPIATNMWALPIPSVERCMLVLSHPLHTSVMLYESSSEIVEGGSDEAIPGFDFDTSTLMVACVPGQLAVQITRHSINVFGLDTSIDPVSYTLEHAECLLAEVDSCKGLFGIACVDKSSQVFYLRLGRVSSDESNVAIHFTSRSCTLPAEPTSLSLTYVGDAAVLVVGAADGSLRFLHAGAAAELELLAEYHIHQIVPNIELSAITSLGVLSQMISPGALILCGLRTGTLLCLLMRGGDSTTPPALTLTEQITLGSTTVSIVTELGTKQRSTSTMMADSTSKKSSSTSTTALVVCGAELRQISLLDGCSALQYRTSSIWFSGFKQESALQLTIDAICRFPVFDKKEKTDKGDDQIESADEDAMVAQPADDDGVDNLSKDSSSDQRDLVVCTGSGQLSVTSLGREEKMVPRRVKVKGAPQRMLYSTELNKIIVALDYITLVQTTKGPKSTIQRLVRPSLQLVDPDPGMTAPRGHPTDELVTVGNESEVMTSMINWRPTDGLKHFDMVVIGIDADAADTKSRSGKVLCVGVKRLGEAHQSDVKTKTLVRYPGQPVFSVCSFGKSSLLVNAGSDVILESFDIETRELSRISRCSLPSAASSLSALGPSIFAATSLHSLCILHGEAASIRFDASDHLARNAIDVVPLAPNLTCIGTISDYGSEVLAFAKQANTKRTRTLFKASLPMIIQKLKQSRARDSTGRDMYGVMIDGTICRFTLLTPQQWRLLDFVQHLSSSNAAVDDDAQDEDYEHVGHDLSTSSRSGRESADRHIRASALAGLLESGSNHLQNLLRDKQGDDENLDVQGDSRLEEFKRLAASMVGVNDNAVEVVTRWVTELLKVPR